MSGQELPPSNLGTKAHWDCSYAQELHNFDDHGDEGEVWFGEDSLYRVLRWLDRHSDSIPLEAQILDLGCGNGITGIHLRQEGYLHVTGVDYSPDAIALARKVAEKHEISDLTFEIGDILQPTTSTALTLAYDLILDKGTYDAVSLNPEASQDKRETYIRNAAAMTKDKGYLIITSCNWTQEELVDHFQKRFSLIHSIPTPQFKFGGKTGNMVTSLVFQKKALAQ
eukprot:maker-scaffold1137_size60140-snap-gene-0.15 protein:Tk10569 transcript:maker-scaffold1137_size60140-snap-gene-0.15-mRNA-1 annotation:"methyltransferase like 10 isoform x2"